MIEKLRKTASALRAEGLKLSDADFEPVKEAQPPADVAAAGPEFVAAWKEYRRCLSIRTKLEPHPVQEPKLNAYTAQGEYAQLIQRLLDGDKPPTPEELARFFYDEHSFCGSGSGQFAEVQWQAMLLAHLDHRRFGDAVKMVLGELGALGQDQVQEDLLIALGFDSHKVLAGAWLDGKIDALHSLCRQANDETAQQVLRWTQLHWDAVVTERGADRRTRVFFPDHRPQLPSFELLFLLNPGNSLTDANRERIAAFLNANGTRLYDLDIWIYELSRLPQGTASRLKPMVRAGLLHEKNEVRSLAERMLHEAGEPDAKAELRAPPGFRLFVDGKAWPDFVTGLLRPGHREGFRPDLGLSVEYFSTDGHSGSASSPGSNREGIIEPEADAFVPVERVKRAYFYSFPMAIGAESTNPEAPWLRAEIPLPPAFGATTDIRVDTVAVTIQPRNPRPLEEYKNKATWVEFGFSHDDERSAPWLSKYHLAGSGPLVLARVQPGDYLIRVHAFGAAKTPLQKMHVSPTATRFEPKLEIGATVTVPLIRGEGLDTLESETPALLLRGSLTDSWGPIRVERNGVPLTEPADANVFPTEEQLNESSAEPSFPHLPPVARANQRDKMILSNLPIGKYVVRLQSSKDLRSTGKLGSGPDGAHVDWKKAAVSFEVTAKSPAEFTTPPLRIETSR